MKTILLALACFWLAIPSQAADVQVREVNDSMIINVVFQTKASQKDVWKILTDYPRIPSFVKQMEISKVLNRSNNDITLEQVVVSRVWGIKKRNRVIFKVHETPQSKISFVGFNAKGVQTCSGFWTVSNHSHIVHVDYNLRLEPKAVRFKYLSKSIILKTTKDIVEGMENEIERRAKTKK